MSSTETTHINVPYVNLAVQNGRLKESMLAAAEKVLNHGCFILGPEVKEFEERFACLCNTRYAVGVGNGTSALSLVLRALDIGPGDEVITAPNSFLASASAIALTGACPVFVDVRDDFNINPDLLEDAVTPRTKAVIPVHLTGRPADLNAVLDVARRHNLHVVEDCAQAVGARYFERPVGGFGVAGCFSLHPLKNLSAAGDGGVITCSDPVLHEKLLQARNHGLLNRDECGFWSPSTRLDTLQAAMLLVKLDHLEGWTEKRRAHAAYYRENLVDLVTVPTDRAHEYAVYHTFVIQAERRDELQQYLSDRGVETKVHYPIPIHLQPAAEALGFKEGSFPETEAQSRRVLSLPVYPELTEPQREWVVNGIKRFYRDPAPTDPGIHR